MASVKPKKNTAAPAAEEKTAGQKAAATKAAKKAAEAKAETTTEAKPAAKKAPAKAAKPTPKVPVAKPKVEETAEATEATEAAETSESAMGRKELAEAIRENVKTEGLAISDKVAVQVVKSFEAVVAHAVAGGHAINLPGFGKFVTKDVPARTGRNPQTGAEVAIPASVKVVFKPGRALKNAANGVTEEVAAE